MEGVQAAQEAHKERTGLVPMRRDPREKLRTAPTQVRKQGLRWKTAPETTRQQQPDKWPEAGNNRQVGIRTDRERNPEKGEFKREESDRGKGEIFQSTQRAAPPPLHYLLECIKCDLAQHAPVAATTGKPDRRTNVGRWWAAIEECQQLIESGWEQGQIETVELHRNSPRVCLEVPRENLSVPRACLLVCVNIGVLAS